MGTASYFIFMHIIGPEMLIVCHCPAEGRCCRIILQSGMLHQVEETVNSNLNFDMLIRTTFMISLENFKDVFIHFIRTS